MLSMSSQVYFASSCSAKHPFLKRKIIKAELPPRDLFKHKLLRGQMEKKVHHSEGFEPPPLGWEACALPLCYNHCPTITKKLESPWRATTDEKQKDCVSPSEASIHPSPLKRPKFQGKNPDLCRSSFCRRRRCCRRRCRCRCWHRCRRRCRHRCR